MSLSKATLCNFFVGNPGAGKSTLANATAEQVFFKSGVSVGSGKTKELDILIKDGVAYVDTPGLADFNLRKQAAAAISKALKEGGVFKVIFVCKQDSGRVRPADATTVNLVLEACDEIVENRYGIIINMCSKVIMDKMKDVDERKLFGSILQQSLPRKTTFYFFLQKHDDLEDMEDKLVAMSELKGYKVFLEQLPTVNLTPNKAKDVKADEFEALNAKLETKDAEIKQVIADAKDGVKKAIDQVAKMKEDHAAEMAKLKEELDGYGGFSFGSMLGGIGSIFGGDARGVKRDVDKAFGLC